MGRRGCILLTYFVLRAWKEVWEVGPIKGAASLLHLRHKVNRKGLFFRSGPLPS